MLIKLDEKRAVSGLSTQKTIQYLSCIHHGKAGPGIVTSEKEVSLESDLLGKGEVNHPVVCELLLHREKSDSRPLLSSPVSFSDPSAPAFNLREDLIPVGSSRTTSVELVV